ncbi:MAG: helix-hairpin-helix domain-containing protein [Candidatus Eisenbacteria bacterium]
MEALTPAERRGALIVVLLLALGAGHDLWRASRPLPGLAPAGAPTAEPLAPRPVPGDPVASGGGASAGAELRESVTLDLNRASAEELDTLPGIGPVLAARIIAHRQRHGPFGSPEELLAVRGIGPRLLARLGPRVRAGSSEAPARPDTLPRAD